MPRKLNYIFPAGNFTDVCQLQTPTGNILTLNGNLADPLTHTVSFISRRYSRQVSIFSDTDLSAITFNVTGTQNGVTFTEAILGPTATNTVYGVETYDIITSITTSAPISPAIVSVGTGWRGFFPLITLNPWPKEMNYTLAINPVVAGSAAQAAVYGSLDNLANNGKTFINNLPGTNPAINNTAVFTVQVMANTPLLVSNATYPTLFSTYLVQVGSTADSVGYATKMTFAQFSSF